LTITPSTNLPCVQISHTEFCFCPSASQSLLLLVACCAAHPPPACDLLHPIHPRVSLSFYSSRSLGEQLIQMPLQFVVVYTEYPYSNYRGADLFLRPMRYNVAQPLGA